MLAAQLATPPERAGHAGDCRAVADFVGWWGQREALNHFRHCSAQGWCIVAAGCEVGAACGLRLGEGADFRVAGVQRNPKRPKPVGLQA